MQVPPQPAETPAGAVQYAAGGEQALTVNKSALALAACTLERESVAASITWAPG